MWFKKKQFQIPATGCYCSPLDKRDVLTSEVFPVVKRIPEACPPPFDLTILNQENKPHCVGFSLATLKQEKELREKVWVPAFDGDWIYYRAKELEGATNPGTYIRIGLKVLQKFGAKPKDAPDSEAIRYRIGGYARVDELTFEGLKKAIFVNGALIAGFYVSSSGWQTAYVKAPKPGERTSGHAVVLIGYNKDYLIGQNSWGMWGDKGLFYVPKDYLPFEAWAVLSDYPTEFLPAPVQLEGWVASEYLKPDLAVGNRVYPSCRLNLRKEPMGEKIITLDVGQKLLTTGITQKVGKYNWVKVRVL